MLRFTNILYHKKHNIVKKQSIFILSLLSLFLFSSCINEEGEGGTGMVDGYVWHVIHPDGEFNFATDTFPAAEMRVYIQYGDERPYSDDMRTGFDGYFKFKYLNKGTYTVFAYNEYQNGKLEAVSETVTIKKGETGTMKDIYIHSGKMYGKSQIIGKLYADYYDGNRLVEANVPVPGERAYIRKKANSDAFPPFDDIRSGADGTFIFEKIPVGDYEIYAISETDDRVLYVDEASIISVSISEEGETVDVGTIKVRMRS